jgi:hypothetical protein
MLPFLMSSIVRAGLTLNESELQAQVIAMCDDLGLYVFHSTDPKRDIGTGFPDLVICGMNGHVFVELKTNSGQLRTNQVRWRNRLTYANAPYALWTPRQLDSGEIRRTLVSLGSPDTKSLSVAPSAVQGCSDLECRNYTVNGHYPH